MLTLSLGLGGIADSILSVNTRSQSELRWVFAGEEGEGGGMCSGPCTEFRIAGELLFSFQIAVALSKVDGPNAVRRPLKIATSKNLC